MSSINRINFLKSLNDYAFTGNPTEIIEILNILIDSSDYEEYLDLIFVSISSTQLYGFLSYFSLETQMSFFESDYFRSNSYRGKNIDFYNSGQLSFLYEIEKYNKIFFSAPTSFGKTSIVIEYILNHYLKINNILFIVPTNSLLEELYTKFNNFNFNLKMNYNVSTQTNVREGRNLLIVTPERFLLIAEKQSIDMFDLLIMDETYKIVDSHNERVSDFINSRAYRFRKVADILGRSKSKVVFLSPFTYYLTESMKKFLEKFEIVKIDRKVEYVKREVISLANSTLTNKYFDSKIVGYSGNIISKTTILLKELSNKKNIVYVAHYTKAYEIVESISFSTLRVNESKRFLSFIEHLKSNFYIENRESWKIIEGLQKGIGIYISPIPRYIKKEIINLFESGIINTLIVTTAFTEGVNTSASNLIFTSLINGPNTNKLSDIDILNVSGRVGRFASKTIGRIFCISELIFNKISHLQDTNEIKLENNNYKQKENHIDFEIDMMDDEFLTEYDLSERSKLEKEVINLGLLMSDFNISLNVSNKWKLNLFKYFQSLDSDKISSINNNIESLYVNSNNNRIEAMTEIFGDLRKMFESNQIDGFPKEFYEIHPFDRNNDFIWGRLYRIYNSGSIKDVISSNLTFITNKFGSVTKGEKYQNKREVEEIFKVNNLQWVLRYYNANLELNFNAFYSETFKFISNVIQYKVPFYLSFYVSIFKLYTSKMNFDNLGFKDYDLIKLVELFEEGEVNKEYSPLLDFGIPLALLMKLEKDNISINDLKDKRYKQEIIDDYEKIILHEALEFIKN